MQLLDVSDVEKQSRLEFLQTKLGSCATSRQVQSGATNFYLEAAKSKYNELIDNVKSTHGHMPDAILLYNHRKGLYNRQTDSSPSILNYLIDQVDKTFSKIGSTYAIIAINSTNDVLKPSDTRNLTVFDPYDRNKPGNQYPGIDPLITSNFWRVCAEEKKILCLV